MLLGGIVAPIASLEAGRDKSVAHSNPGRKTFALVSRKSQSQTSGTATGNSNKQLQTSSKPSLNNPPQTGGTNSNKKGPTSVVLDKTSGTGASGKPLNNKETTTKSDLEVVVDFGRQWMDIQAAIDKRIDEVEKEVKFYNLDQYEIECIRRLQMASEDEDRATEDDLNLFLKRRDAQKAFQNAREKLINDIQRSPNDDGPYSKEQLETLRRITADWAEKLGDKGSEEGNPLDEILETIDRRLKAIDNEENHTQQKKKKRCKKNEKNRSSDEKSSKDDEGNSPKSSDQGNHD